MDPLRRTGLVLAASATALWAVVLVGFVTTGPAGAWTPARPCDVFPPELLLLLWVTGTAVSVVSAALFLAASPRRGGPPTGRTSGAEVAVRHGVRDRRCPSRIAGAAAPAVPEDRRQCGHRGRLSGR